ncbi:MAG: C4-dicarboxylate ABC transporter substrate-binding protein, partial [Halomonas sp.]
MTQRFARRALTAAIGGIVATALILPAQAATEVNVGYAIPSESHYGEGYRAFKETLEQLSDGEFTAAEHP